MSRLAFVFLRELLGRYGIAAIPIWLLLAALVSAESTLGHGSLGFYLSLVSLFPMVLLWRYAMTVERRQQQGWPEEERLRDRRGWRMPTAELLGAVTVLGAGLALAMIPAATTGLRQDSDWMETGANFPVRVQSSNQDWRLSWEPRLPDRVVLQLVTDWPQGAAPGTSVSVLRDGQRLELVPGPQELVLTATELQARELHLGAVPSQVRFDPMRTRLAVMLPGFHELPSMLALHALFFLPLIAIVSWMVRVLRVRAELAAIAALSLAALASWDPGVLGEISLGESSRSLESPVQWLAQGLIAFRLLLPDIGGLLPSGADYELEFGTCRAPSALAWLAIGAVVMIWTLLWRRRRP